MTDKHIPASKLMALQRYEIFAEDETWRTFKSDTGTLIYASDLRKLIDEAPEVESVRCVYSEQIGMPEYSCANKCQYALNPSTDLTKLVGDLVEALEKSREKLQIECGGNREYKGGVPTQVLFPTVDALLTRAKEYLK